LSAFHCYPYPLQRSAAAARPTLPGVPAPRSGYRIEMLQPRRLDRLPPRPSKPRDEEQDEALPQRRLER